jgi:hypothetical protein
MIPRRACRNLVGAAKFAKRHSGLRDGLHDANGHSLRRHAGMRQVPQALRLESRKQN